MASTLLFFNPLPLAFVVHTVFGRLQIRSTVATKCTVQDQYRMRLGVSSTGTRSYRVNESKRHTPHFSPSLLLPSSQLQHTTDSFYDKHSSSMVAVLGADYSSDAMAIATAFRSANVSNNDGYLTKAR